MSKRIDGKYLFSFVVVGDTHVNQREDFSSSPYPCNALANARARHVFSEINKKDAEFVVHLGDMINPVPELPTYGDAADRFKELAADLNQPMHLVPGNHDIGDKPVSWAPAGRVCDEYIDLYQQHFGKHYFSFDANDLHLVVINASIMNSGLEAEAEQKSWLVSDLAAAADKRTFIFIHYPPYVSDPAETGSYDNIDEPARSWLLDQCRKFKPEAMFCGHVHNFWYDHVAETEIYVMPSTSFVRHDYSEMYRIGPGSQFGRNDEPKLGYAVVHVYEQGHLVDIIRTNGETLETGQYLLEDQPSINRVRTKQSNIDCIGLDMRQPWAEELEIAPSGGVDEFERKLARNDYPVLAMWEMGIRLMRVPIQDLSNPRIRRRMEIMAQVGHVFQVYSYGLPDVDTVELLERHADLVDRLEIVIGWENAEEEVQRIAALSQQTGCQVILSRANRKDGGKHTGGQYNHLISHGFTHDETDELAEFFDTHPQAEHISGVMFSIRRETEPAEAIALAEQAAQKIGRKIVLYVKSTSSSPAQAFESEKDNASRCAQAIVAGIGAQSVEVILDTFADVDRGYFARAGLVDRRHNPKLGSHVVGNIFSIFNGNSWGLSAVTNTDLGLTETVELLNENGARAILVMPDAEGPRTIEGCEVQAINLRTGSPIEFDPKKRNRDDLVIVLAATSGGSVEDEFSISL